MKLSSGIFFARSTKIFMLCTVLLATGIIWNAPTLSAAPQTRTVRILNAGDRLVVRRQGCDLRISFQTTAKIIVRCGAATAASAEQNSPQVKSSIVMLSGDRVIAKANACALKSASVSAARVVIACSAVTQAWLEYVNQYRALANLPAVTENTAWSNGNQLHARYMVKNDYIGHSEDPNNPWYTPEGNAAANNSDVAVSGSASMSDQAAIDLWMQGPFHAVGVIDPALAVVGFGSYREADSGFQTGAGLDVLRGLGNPPSSITFPVMYPSDNKTIALNGYYGGESPNPLSACAGYAAPTGLPIILQIGGGSVTPNVTAHSFKQGSTELEHCIYDETNYTNSASSHQNLGRNVLGARDAIVLIPRQVLEVGKSYTVSITTNGQTHTWSFTIANNAAKPSATNAEFR